MNMSEQARMVEGDYPGDVYPRKTLLVFCYRYITQKDKLAYSFRMMRNGKLVDGDDGKVVFLHPLKGTRKTWLVGAMYEVPETKPGSFILADAKYQGPVPSSAFEVWVPTTVSVWRAEDEDTETYLSCQKREAEDKKWLPNVTVEGLREVTRRTNPQTRRRIVAELLEYLLR